jgi:serine protease
MLRRIHLFAAACLCLATVPLSAPQASAAQPVPMLRTPAQQRAVAPAAQRFIVRWQPYAGERLRGRTLAAATRAAMSSARAAPSLRSLRRMADGSEVVLAARPLRASESAALQRALAADPAVLHVEPDRLLRHTGAASAGGMHPALVPNDEFYADYQWHLHDPVGGIRAPAAWNVANGTGVVVAVIDTGITRHPDLDANVLPGYDFISDAFVSRRASNARVAGAKDYGDWTNDGDCGTGWIGTPSSWHGTHVAGTVAERTHNTVGMAGVAFRAKVLPLRALGRCGGYTSDIADAITWAAGAAVPGLPANINPAEVINLSIGGPGACTAQSAMQRAIDVAVARGAVVVAAAGNDGTDAAGYSPASCNHVVTVGAGRVTGARAAYSNYGLRVDLAGPGGGGEVDGARGYVFQSWLENAPTVPEEGNPWYIGMAGTSMAAPHVSGVAALVQSALTRPLTPAAMRELLKLSARPFPVRPESGKPIGAGLLDAPTALQMALHPCTGSCVPQATMLRNGVAVGGLAGAAGSTRLFAIKVPAGVSALRILSYGGSGDVALWASARVEPTATKADYRADRLGNNEVITVPVPRYGPYYIKLVGRKAYAQVSLQARY